MVTIDCLNRTEITVNGSTGESKLFIGMINIYRIVVLLIC